MSDRWRRVQVTAILFMEDDTDRFFVPMWDGDEWSVVDNTGITYWRDGDAVRTFIADWEAEEPGPSVDVKDAYLALADLLDELEAERTS